MVYENKEVPNMDNNLIAHSHNQYSKEAGPNIMRQFNPYTNNQGTTIAIAGKDYCLIASDTRISQGYSILQRDYSRTT